jgi:hypothetical protein
VKNSENQLLWLIVGARLILDGVAGLFFLIQGKPKHTLAIIKAHFQFYSRLRTYLRERTNSFNTTVKPVKRAIVFDYYIKGYEK